MTRWWRDPFVLGFAAVAVVAVPVSSLEAAGWLSGLVFWVGLAASELVVVWMTRSRLVPADLLEHRFREGWPALAWYVVFVNLSLAFPDSGLLSGELSKWLWFIVLPLALLYLMRVGGAVWPIP